VGKSLEAETLKPRKKEQDDIKMDLVIRSHPSSHFLIYCHQ